MIKPAGLSLLVIGIISVFYFLFERTHPGVHAQIDKKSQSHREVSSISQKKPSLSQQSNKGSPLFLKKERELDHTSKNSWESFAKKFGESLVPEFSPDHYLASIQGAIGQGVSARKDFKTENQKDVSIRAQEIVAALSPMIGFNQEWPLEIQTFRLTESSAQVFFRETYQGVPVEPNGRLVINLGPAGEILGVYSDYYFKSSKKQLQTPNLTESDIHALAVSFFEKYFPLPIQLEEGEKIVWVPQVTYAYKFAYQGREVVVDADSGRVLMYQDRRIF